MKLNANTRIEFSTTFLFMVALALYVLTSIWLPAPIFGSDEYAFFISGKFIDRLPELYQLDPGLQKVSNVFYLRILHLLMSVSGNHFITVYRIIHSVEYVIAGLLLHRIFLNMFGKGDRNGTLLCFFMLPTILYIQAVMPEIELLLLSICASYFMIILFPKKQIVASLLAGVTAGAAILIKPHAVALVAAICCFIVLYEVLILKLRNTGRIAINLLCFLIASYLSFVLTWRFGAQSWSFNPMDGLSLNLYGPSLAASSNNFSIFSKAGSALFYAVAHFIVAFLIFGPALLLSISEILRAAKLSTRPRGVEVVLFAILLLILNIAMTSWFTAGAAAVWPGEGMRLHGRYLISSFAFLPFIYFFAVQNMSAIQRKITGVLLFASAALCGFSLFNSFKLFPWDHPVLFAFFKFPNHYDWSYIADPVNIGPYLLGLIAFFSILSILRPGLQRRLFISQLLVILACGCFQTFSWVRGHLEVNGKISNAGTLALDFLPSHNFGDGLVITKDRYGSASYAMFGLGSAPRVLGLPLSEEITAQVVQSASWAIVDNDYVVDLPNYEMRSIGPFKVLIKKN